MTLEEIENKLKTHPKSLNRLAAILDLMYQDEDCQFDTDKIFDADCVEFLFEIANPLVSDIFSPGQTPS